MGVSIILDTNALYNSKFNDFTEIKFINKIYDIVDFIKENNFRSRVKIIIPRIVADELLEQQLACYKNTVNNFFSNKFPMYNKSTSSIMEPKDYEEYLEDKLYNEIKGFESEDVKVEIINISNDFKIENVIKRAIKKQPPFLGEGKESDKGFKDVILWETLLEYKHKNRFETILLCTSDKIFKKREIFEEYKDTFNEDLIVSEMYSNDNNVYDVLGDLFETNPKLSKELKIVLEFGKLINSTNLTEMLGVINYRPEFKNKQYKLLNIEGIYIDEVSDIVNLKESAGLSNDIFRYEVGIDAFLSLIDEDKYNSMDLSSAKYFVDVRTNNYIECEVLYYERTKEIIINAIFIDGKTYNIRYLLNRE